MGLIEKLEQIKTLVESGAGGSGSEDWRFNGVAYLFDYERNPNNVLIFDELLKHFPKQTPSLYYTFRSSFTNRWMNNEMFKKILQLDLSECTTLEQAFYGVGFDLYGEFSINIPKCTNLYNAFQFWKINKDNYNNPNGNVILNFNGTTSNVVNFNSSFGSNNSRNLSNIGGILNINMDKCTNSTSVVSYSNISRFTFSGSFGGLSTSSTLTLDFSTYTKMDYSGIIETFNTISENTNGKTRIIKLSSVLYSTLTEDELAIATNKGYTITSA